MKTFAYLAGLFLVVLLAYGLGFLVFASSLPQKPDANVHADAIVVLTGGDDRLEAAAKLLEQKRAKRLLVTGVHQEITKPEIKEIAHGGKRFDCCADLDFAAEDTRGNAAEAASWIKAHRFKSLILVTANYHMPRSLAEFSANMPGVKIIPYPVEPEGVDFAGWWHHPRTARMLHAEYVKYLASLVLDHVVAPPQTNKRSG
ncbi:MAG TPA: YdcF family protein [Rhizomicrobium sp.]|nr:YdcF family protein [Rhizomicrobium sp.]